MKNICFYLMFLVCVAALALHAHGSQEARLKQFIMSRRNSDSSSDTFKVDIPSRVASSLLITEDSVSHQSSLKMADKITALPGQPVGAGPEGVDFDQYSGYVTVDEENGRALFYYFVEAPSDASEKPLLLWLNGGPGCSSLGYGAMQELGPFRVSQDNKTLSRNKHAWNPIFLFGFAIYMFKSIFITVENSNLVVKIVVANVIFLESPAGVGFSYSNTSSDYDLSGDQRTADDSYRFLVNWLMRFPEYKDRAFYISGESFAGHYVPELAATILIQNKYNNKTTINLQGILVGNAYLDGHRNIKGALEFFWSHAVISDEVFANITKYCNFDNNDPEGDACYGAIDAFDIGPIDGYDIYAPVCIEAADGTYHPSGYLPGYDPCSDYPTHDYLNDPMVQNAFHARMTKWSGCSDLNWTDAPVSMLPTLQWLMDNKLPVWLFSGDFDSACPFPATRYTINDLGIYVTSPWRPWTAKEEVGGYVQQYKGGFTFLTVRGAGHLVPSFQPERALIMLDSFLKGTLPPYIKEE